MKNTLGKYFVAPDVPLSKGDEKSFTAFFIAYGFLDLAQIWLGLDFLDQTWLRLVWKSVSAPDKKKENPRSLKIWTDGEKYFIHVKDLKEKTKSFKEIKIETADFFIRWLSFIHKIDECKKIQKEIERISDVRRKKNGMPYFDKKKDPKFCEMMESFHKLHQEKHEIMKTSKFEEVARCQDKIGELQSQIIKYLLKKYPKRKILKSKFLEQVLYTDSDDMVYTFHRLY